MNIKYMSLLSLFCAGIASADRHNGNIVYQPKTNSVIEKFDQTKQANIACLTRKRNQSPWSRLIEGCINCEKEEEAFETAFAEFKEEFKAALDKNDFKTVGLLSAKINQEHTDDTNEVLTIAGR